MDESAFHDNLACDLIVLFLARLRIRAARRKNLQGSALDGFPVTVGVGGMHLAGVAGHLEASLLTDRF